MRPALGRTAAIAFAVSVFSLASCASSGTSSRRARADTSLITREQITKYHFANAHEAVEALHSNWLLTKGTDSFQAPSQVRVYLDNTLLGGVESLRTIDINTIYAIRHFSGLAATARWGIDHGQGVIQVTTVR